MQIWRISTVVLVILFAACSSKGSKSLPAHEAAELLVDRNWMDHWPTDKDERLQVYRFTPAMGGGVFQDRTLFRGSFELFTFERDKSMLRFYFPHDDERIVTDYRVEEVDGPRPFDLKLTLSRSPRGGKVFYGSRDEGATALGAGAVETER